MKNWRAFGTQPAFLSAVILTLALGIGVNAAVFSLVYGVLLRPLPFPDEQSLVFLLVRNQEGGSVAVSPPDLFDWRQQVTRLALLSGYTASQLNVGLEDGTRHLSGGVVTQDFLKLLGARPLHGRLFSAADFRPGSEPVVLLAEGFWRRSFGGDVAAVGRSVRISGQPFRVVGVVPEEIRIGKPFDLWIPLTVDPTQVDRDARYLVGLGRLKPGVALRGAQAEMAVVSRRLATRFPGSHAGLEVQIVPFRERVTRELQPKLLALWGTVGFACLLVGANTAFLYLVRLDRRQRDFALRLVFGASRWALWRHVLGELLILALLAALGGLGFAAGVVKALQRLRPDALPGLEQASFGQVVIFYTLGLSLLVGLAVGLLALLRLPTRNLQGVLATADRKGYGGGGSRSLQGALLLVQVALALVLLDGAGLMLRSLRNLSAVDPGFEASRLLTASVVFPSAQYPPGSAQVWDFVRQGIGSLETLPGVERAASSILAPIGGGTMERVVSVEGRDIPGFEGSEGAPVAEQAVSPEYFQTLGVRFIRGRAFRAGETTGAVVNRLFAERFLAGDDPLGQWLRVQTPFSPVPLRLEVVGVVEPERQIALSQDPVPAIYLPHALELMPFATFFVRTENGSAVSSDVVRKALQEIDGEVAVDEAKAMESVLAESIADERTLARLLGAAAILALLLVAIGVYGVRSLAVGQRLQELGIRLSLGATPRGITRSVVAAGLRSTLVGLALGAAGAQVLNRRLSTFLFDVEPTRLVTLAGGAVLVLGATLLASYLPAKRAGRVDPAVVLRQD